MKSLSVSARRSFTADNSIAAVEITMLVGEWTPRGHQSSSKIHPHGAISHLNAHCPQQRFARFNFLLKSRFNTTTTTTTTTNNKYLSYRRETALHGELVMANSGRLELGVWETIFTDIISRYSTTVTYLASKAIEFG